MKNLLILTLVIFGLTSCSKDSLDPIQDAKRGPEKSEIMVSVGYLNWSNNQCEPGSGSLNAQELSVVVDARVSLYLGEETQSDASVSPLMDLRTDRDGSVLFENIEPGIYTVRVETDLGNKFRTLTTQINKRSYIDFSF